MKGSSLKPLPQLCFLRGGEDLLLVLAASASSTSFFFAISFGALARGKYVLRSRAFRLPWKMDDLFKYGNEKATH